MNPKKYCTKDSNESREQGPESSSSAEEVGEQNRYFTGTIVPADVTGTPYTSRSSRIEVDRLKSKKAYKVNRRTEPGLISSNFEDPVVQRMLKSMNWPCHKEGNNHFDVHYSRKRVKDRKQDKTLRKS